MEEELVLRTLTCLVFGGFVFLSSRLAFDLMKRVGRERRRRSNAWDGETYLGWVVRNGISPLLPLCDKLCSLNWVGAAAERAVRVFAFRGFVSNRSSILSLALVASITAGLLGILFGGGVVGGFALGAGTLLALSYWSRSEEERVLDDCKEEVPEALRTMQACFSVGHSLPQTLEQVSRVENPVLSSLFSESSSVLKSGGTVHESLECLRRGSRSKEISFLATALEIQHRTGSSVQQVLDVTRESIEEDLEMGRNLRTQTAQARLSARIVTAMPFALVALFSIMSEGFLTPFFESPTGILMLVVALIMQVAGVLIVRNMLKVEVS